MIKVLIQASFFLTEKESFLEVRILWFNLLSLLGEQGWLREFFTICFINAKLKSK